MLTLLRPWKSLNTFTPNAPFKASRKVFACVCSNFLLSITSTVDGVSLTVICVLVAVTTIVSKENSCRVSSAAKAVPPQSTLPASRLVKTKFWRFLFCILISLLQKYILITSMTSLNNCQTRQCRKTDKDDYFRRTVLFLSFYLFSYLLLFASVT